MVLSSTKVLVARGGTIEGFCKTMAVVSSLAGVACAATGIGAPASVLWGLSAIGYGVAADFANALGC